MTTDEMSRNIPSTGLRYAASKVPEVTVTFWLAKALSTAMGESTSDFLVHRMPPVIAVALGALGFAVAMVVQFAARRYVPWIYWLAVAMVGIFGTMAADVAHVGFGIPYLVSTATFAVALAAIFVLWYASEKTLSIHSIHTRRREVFYWAAVMATFALGTAAGDMTAKTLHLGYLPSGIIFAALIAISAVAYWRFGLNPIIGFWFSYILTRPVGASFADWMGVSHARGGLGWGTGPVSLVLALLIVGCVVSMTSSHRKAAAQHQAAEPTG